LILAVFGKLTKETSVLGDYLLRAKLTKETSVLGDYLLRASGLKPFYSEPL